MSYYVMDVLIPAVWLEEFSQNWPQVARQRTVTSVLVSVLLPICHMAIDKSFHFFFGYKVTNTYHSNSQLTFILHSFQNSGELSNFILDLPFLHSGNLRLREGKWLVQKHTAGRSLRSVDFCSHALKCAHPEDTSWYHVNRRMSHDCIQVC
jgi:hypothetical protein